MGAMSHGDDQLDLFAPAGAPAEARTRRGSGVEPVAPTPEALALAEALPREVHLGTSSWSFPGWEGIVYAGRHSPERLARDGLRAYARHPLLRMVGVDRGYYAPIPVDELTAYAAAVGPGFRFLVKAHEVLTTAVFPRHARYGARRGRPSEEFLDPENARAAVVEPIVQGLGAAAGPILFQFAPQDVASVGGPRNLADRLHRFLDALPRGPLYAVEVRNAEILTPEYAAALRSVGACHCINVYPGMPAPLLQRQRALTDLGPALVVRWMLHPRLTYEQAFALFQPFDRLVEEDLTSRRAIAQLCAESAAARRPAFVIVNNKAEGSSPRTVERLAEAIVQRAASARPS